MTVEQLALGDCDPSWPDDDLDELCLYGAADIEESLAPYLWDLRGQGLTNRQLGTITTVTLKGGYL